MELIATLAGGPPLSWALGATDRHGAPRAAQLAHRDAPTVTQCPCGVVAHPDALQAMGHATCARPSAVRTFKTSEPLEAQLRCDTCARTFGLSGPRLADHTESKHRRKPTTIERTPRS